MSFNTVCGRMRATSIKPAGEEKSENSSVDKSVEQPEKTTGIDADEHQEESSGGLSTKEKAVSPQPRTEVRRGAYILKTPSPGQYSDS